MVLGRYLVLGHLDSKGYPWSHHPLQDPVAICVTEAMDCAVERRSATAAPLPGARSRRLKGTSKSLERRDGFLIWESLKEELRP